ncbi:hypothetical protein [Aquipseudomonas alcaligenes]|uniref:hypothetical protein n=1 Tax=Aquipseudomonas alcaligenes TaxID=43263 RepID=UPI003747F705
MAIVFVVKFKSGSEVQFRHNPEGGPWPASIREKFEAFIKSKKQDVWTFSFRDRPKGDPVFNPNKHFTVDFADVAAIWELENQS